MTAHETQSERITKLEAEIDRLRIDNALMLNALEWALDDMKDDHYVSQSTKDLIIKAISD